MRTEEEGFLVRKGEVCNVLMIASVGPRGGER